MKALFSVRTQALWAALLALLIMPPMLLALGLTLTSATDVVIFAIAALGLNLLVGYCGLTSFGHGAWFGLGAYAAALAQKHWFDGQIVVPFFFSVAFVALLALLIGLLILRRRGVYFSLLSLALSALTFAVAFRWSNFTGGESGLGGVRRPAIGWLDLEQPWVYLVVVSVIAWLLLYALQRVVRSPFGRVVVAIRENEQRASFLGYDTQRYKLAIYVLSAAVTGLAGALLVFHHRFASAEPTGVAFSGELLAMVVIGGMRSFMGPALGALFYILFREFLSIWTDSWQLYFGLAFVGFILFSPTGLVGVWSRLTRRWRRLPELAAAMSQRQIHAGLPLPACLRRNAPDDPGAEVLRVRALQKSFGGIDAVQQADLLLQAGQIHALIGPNGAGKTTTFNLISGLFPPDGGQVLLRGQAIGGLAPHQICERGLARSFQITNLFKGLSIHENLRLALQARHRGRCNPWRDARQYAAVNAETAQLMKFLGLQGIEEVPAGDLSYGGQRLVDLGIALGCKPQVLLLDEPLAGLAAAERERIAQLVRSIAENIPVLIVEHDIDRVLALSDQVTVMNQGRVLMTGSPPAVRTDARVQEIYTGSATPPLSSRSAAPQETGRPILRIEGVNTFYGKSHILNDATLDVRPGEIVALLGRNGAGKSTLLKTLTGLLRPASGRIEYQGRDIAGLPAPQIARLGVGYVPQGRGLFAGMTVAENLALGRLARPTDGKTGVVWSEQQILEFFPRLRERMNTPADYLSGGEQQMVAVARALSGNVRLLLLDEPFEGLAPAVVQELFRAFDRLRQQVAMVIVEHNLDLVLALADRVFALERGAVFHSGPTQPLRTDLNYRKQILWL